jgi:hypothetical protein
VAEARALRRVAAAAAALAAVLGAGAAPARAEFGVQPGGFAVEALAADGATAVTQAGAHPHSLRVRVAFNRHTDETWGEVPDGDVKDMIVDLPAGLTASPGSLPKCAWGDFNPTYTYEDAPRCPSSTQVGVATIDLVFFGPTRAAIFNLEPREGRPADFGFYVAGVRVVMEGDVRSGGDYGLRTTLRGISQTMGVRGADVVLWGVPADPSHDAERAKPGEADASTGAPAGVPPRPLLTNPSHCAGERTATLTYRSWQDPATWRTASSTMPAIDGCDELGFAPAVAVRPAELRADTPTGVDIEVSLPPDDDPDALGGALLRSATTRLPEGLTINPGAAEGLQTCAAPGSCPDASKIGDVTIETPALSVPLTGPIHLGEPAPGAPFRLFVAARGAGVEIRLVGSLTADPATGQLTTRFEDAPQQPFTRLRLRLKGGPRALLTTPQRCGPATTTTEMTSWGGQTAAPSHTFTVEGCDPAAPFSPELSAGVTAALAGISSPFVLRVARGDGQPPLAAIRDLRLPAGLLADTRGVPLCAADQARAGTCGPESQIGTLTVAAGSGPAPLRLPGRIHLTEGAGGMPLGLALVVPAAAGPYDLGVVVVRAGLRVEPDGSLSLDPEPMPSILGGIPLRLREVALAIERPGFMLNPTSCREQRVTATVVAADGAAAPVASRFQLGGCDALPFAPRLTASSAGSSRTAGAALRVDVEGRPGDANLRSVSMTLPRVFGPRMSALAATCPPEQHAADACPAGSSVGTATARIAILPEPLTGPAYLVASEGGLPTPAARLKGNGLVVPVLGEIGLVDGRLRATFDGIPDVPIAHFTLDLPMGPNAPLSASGGLCGRSLLAGTRLVAQSGHVLEQETPIRVDGCRRRAGRGLRVLRTEVRGRRATIVVGGVAAGTLTARGRGILPARRRLSRGPVARLGLTLRAAQARRLRQRGAVRLALRIANRPARRGAAASVLRTRVTFRRARG